MTRPASRASSWDVSRLRSIAVPMLVSSLIGLGALGLLRLTTAEEAPSIHIRWRAGTSDANRAAFERDLLLGHPIHTEGTTYAYDLLDPRAENVRAIVQHPAVDDTHEIDRLAFQVRPEAPAGVGVRWMVHELPVLRHDDTRGVIVTILWLLLAASGALLLIGRPNPALTSPGQNPHAPPDA